MTEMIRRLERDGLIERRPDPSDARASLIFLTARSRRFEPVAAAVLAELDRLARRRLEPRRVAELKAALVKLVDLG
jgi:DNA-binding MarR family transcriptional regulator